MTLYMVWVTFACFHWKNCNNETVYELLILMCFQGHKGKCSVCFLEDSCCHVFVYSYWPVCFWFDIVFIIQLLLLCDIFIGILYQPWNVNCEHQILVSAVHNTNLVLQEHQIFYSVWMLSIFWVVLYMCVWMLCLCLCVFCCVVHVVYVVYAALCIVYVHILFVCCVCVQVVCVHVCMCACVCVHVVCVLVSMCTCVCVHVCMCACVCCMYACCMCVYVCGCMLYLCMCVLYVCVLYVHCVLCMCVCSLCKCVHVCMYVLCVCMCVWENECYYPYLLSIQSENCPPSLSCQASRVLQARRHLPACLVHHPLWKFTSVWIQLLIWKFIFCAYH